MIQAIKYPVKYNNSDNIIEDANGMTIALLAWPNCMLPIELVDSRGKELESLLNSAKTNKILDYVMPRQEVTNITKDVSVIEKTSNFVGKMIDKVNGRKSGKIVKSVRVYLDVDGNRHEIAGRGRASRGWKLLEVKKC